MFCNADCKPCIAKHYKFIILRKMITVLSIFIAFYCVGKLDVFFADFLFVAVFTGSRTDPCLFTAFMGQIMGEYPPCSLKYIIRKHMVTMRRMFLVLFG
jgi:hypothetical protein